MRVGAAVSGSTGMMHCRMGSDPAPDRIDTIGGLLAYDLEVAEDMGGREMRRNE